MQDEKDSERINEKSSGDNGDDNENKWWKNVSPGVLQVDNEEIANMVGPIEDKRPTVLKGRGPTASVEWHPTKEMAQAAIDHAKQRDNNHNQER